MQNFCGAVSPPAMSGRVLPFFDVRTREGGTRKWGGETGADLISGKGFVEGPCQNEGGASYSLGASPILTFC
ncbi:MAG: hypothetical protein R2788_21645 [Saprospiraceae bacterium]